MKASLTTWIGLLLGGLALLPTAVGAVMSQAEYDRLKMNWAVQNGGTVPEPIRATATPQYNLFNLTIERVLRYKSQRGDSINLGWGERNQAFHVRFVKSDRSAGVI